MDSSSLTNDQIAALARIVRRDLRFLGKLRARMEQLGFTPGDRLYQVTTAAYNALHAMSVELHYMGCGSGVARGTGQNGSGIPWQ